MYLSIYLPIYLQVQCWSCGSLFSTDAPDCDAFNSLDPAQVKTCDPGEACLYYSWRKSATETSVIRECFPTSILLGSIESPVEAASSCVASSLESDSISACICTTPLCNGVGGDDIRREVASAGPSVTSPAPRVRTTTTTATTTTTTTTAAPGVPRVAGRVRCHQCGSLFSGSSSNPDCDQFDPADPRQASSCAAGEVCLWYSWQKARGSRSTIRQCFSPSIVLGSPDQALAPRPACRPQLLGSSESGISACLCTSDLCNSYTAPGEVTAPAPRPPPRREESGGREPKFSTSRQSSNTIGNHVPPSLALSSLHCQHMIIHPLSWLTA